MVVVGRYDWRTFEAPEPRTEPDIPIPCAVLVAIPCDWTTSTGTVCARYGVHHLSLTWVSTTTRSK